eukprot:2964888-Lingulodinium_polyedra.AAC.1
MQQGRPQGAWRGPRARVLLPFTAVPGGRGAAPAGPAGGPVGRRRAPLAVNLGGLPEEGRGRADP